MRKYNNKSNVISKILKKSRLDQNLSQSALCRKLELLGIVMTKEDLSKIEKNNKIVKDFEVWGISRALSISLDELFDEINKEFDDE